MVGLCPRASFRLRAQLQAKAEFGSCRTSIARKVPCVSQHKLTISDECVQTISRGNRYTVKHHFFVSGKVFFLYMLASV